MNLRRQHNADLIRRMRNGDPLNTIDSKASWFPPRPLIQKDPEEIARLYNTPSEGPVMVREGAPRAARRETGNVTKLRTPTPVSYDKDPLGEAS